VLKCFFSLTFYLKQNTIYFHVLGT
jgi:hypothetical protein